MCTAATYLTKDFYFGRNLDLHMSYNEGVTITPRDFPFHFRCGKNLNQHYAIIGMATVVSDYPLYFDATNEKGLSLAGLNFPKNAVYYEKKENKENITPFELIPWILGQCATVAEALCLLEKMNLWNDPFSQHLPLSPLHWMLADRERCVVLEPMADGLKIHENPIGILTNNPPFEYHMYHLADFMNATSRIPTNRFASQVDLIPYSLGMGSIGIPGDMSSASRFVKAAFTKLNSISGNAESESISQFFHILGSVTQQRGLTAVEGEEYEFTLYSSCCNTDKGIYYYTTYENSQITAVSMHNENLDQQTLIFYPLVKGQQIFFQN